MEMVKKHSLVAVAMSAGVDSSVAAAILKQAGYRVIGVTISFNLLGAHVVENARRVARQLGIEHRVLDLSQDLQKRVIDNFCKEYCLGRTPNPCIRCNQYVKFGALLKQALNWGCDFLATGHYVRKVKTARGFLLKKGRDKEKDQSYFLYRLTQQQLKNLLFPLGNLTKKEVIGIARKLRLPVAQSKESQEICFLLDTDYRGFLKKQVSRDIKPGLVVDKMGNVLGQHQGIPFYTIGQREGLNLALGHRAYVVKINPGKNQIVLGNLKDTYSQEFRVIQPSFVLRPDKKKIVCKVKIRYNHRATRAKIIMRKKGLRVRFDHAQFAITPGQSAVFYDHDVVIGGGVIK